MHLGVVPTGVRPPRWDRVTGGRGPVRLSLALPLGEESSCCPVLGPGVPCAGIHAIVDIYM